MLNLLYSELLAEIVSCLDYDSLLAVEICCRHCYQITHRKDFFSYLGWKNKEEYKLFCLEYGDVSLWFIGLINPLNLLKRAVEQEDYRCFGKLIALLRLDLLPKDVNKEDIETARYFFEEYYKHIQNPEMVEYPSYETLQDVIFEGSWRGAYLWFRKNREVIKYAYLIKAGYFANYNYIGLKDNIEVACYLKGALQGRNYGLVQLLDPSYLVNEEKT